MKALRISVIGCGYLGSIHARLWRQCEKASLVGVYDIVASRATSLAQELNVRAFSSLEEALNLSDAVTIAVPTRFHAEVSCQALAFGKHVLLEKPVAATVAEAKAIAEAARRAGTVVHVGHVERFNAAFVEAQRFIEQPLFIEAHRLSPFRVRGTDVSVINDLMIHDLDLVLAIVRRPVVRVEAHGVSVISDSIDIANARIEFAEGCIANLTASRLTPKPLRKLRIFQPNAYLSLDFVTPDLEVYRLIQEEHPANISTLSPAMPTKTIVCEHPHLNPTNAIAEEHRAFIAAICEGTSGGVSLEQGIAAVELATAIEQQILQRVPTLLRK
ncbi:MAG: Gfo/Idh/MocA family oxidoreductase [Candidatus Kapabacteria bacterium]|nr:Gfo/Idh/MocA family oxidoreductase [Candidatus Kapabacteria bacterium]